MHGVAANQATTSLVGAKQARYHVIVSKMNIRLTGIRSHLPPYDTAER
jgi:hypothetical protein